MHFIKASVVVTAKQLVSLRVVLIQSCFVVSLTEQDGCLSLCCCYRTLVWMDEALGHIDFSFYTEYSWATRRV